MHNERRQLLALLMLMLNIQSHCCSNMKQNDDQPVIWMNTVNENGETVIYGWVNGETNGTMKYTINISEKLNIHPTVITSEIMVNSYSNVTNTLQNYIIDLCAHTDVCMPL